MAGGVLAISPANGTPKRYCFVGDGFDIQMLQLQMLHYNSASTRFLAKRMLCALVPF